MKKILFIFSIFNYLLVSAQFNGNYDVSNWTLTNSNGNGSVNTTGMPTSFILNGTDGLNLQGSTYYTVTVDNNTEQISFSWDYTTNDGPPYDYPRIQINELTTVTFTGFNLMGTNNQGGTMIVTVTPVDSFAFEMYSVDGCCGAASVTISDFQIQTISNSLFLNKYGALVSDRATQVNENGEIGVSGIDQNGKKSN